MSNAIAFTPYLVVDFAGVSRYNDSTHSLVVVVKSYALLLAGGCMGLFSYADGEAFAADLLNVGLIDLGHDLFESGAVETL